MRSCLVSCSSPLAEGTNVKIRPAASASSTARPHYLPPPAPAATHAHAPPLHPSPCSSFPAAEDIYGGNRVDVLFRCALLSKAALEAPWSVPCGGAPYGEDNLVFVANDWHTSLLPLYLQASVCVCVCGRGGRGGYVWVGGWVPAGRRCGASGVYLHKA